MDYRSWSSKGVKIYTYKNLYTICLSLTNVAKISLRLGTLTFYDSSNLGFFSNTPSDLFQLKWIL